MHWLKAWNQAPRSLPQMSEPSEVGSFPPPQGAEAEPEELRVEPDGTLVIEMKLPEEDELDEEFLDEFEKDIYRQRLLGAGYFEVDQDGILELPGIASIPLGGLTADEATARLQAEPLLRDLLISVTILPLSPLGEAALKPFGYTLFDERPDLFGSTTPQAVPVPRDYILGPGDSLRVQLYGDDNYEVELEVTTEGTINFPKIGPQSVAGLTFGEVKEAIERRTRDQIIGTQAAVSMGRLKTIRVFVVGDVKRPGAYDVSSLSRITSALYRSGGISEVGSLRRVQLLRNGKLRSTLDLYDLLLKGDTRADAQLQPEDVILIPPVGPTVGVTGEVRRPAIYELGGDRSLTSVVALAGGLKPTADKRRLQLERISESGARRIETLDYSSQGQDTKLVAGDLLLVYPVLDDVDGAVAVAGHVTRPGSYEWFSGMRIMDLLPNQQYLKPQADLNYVLIRRELGRDRKTIVISADLGAAHANPESNANILLAPRDKVTVFEQGVARSATISAILDQLNAQANNVEPYQVAGINGEVNAPAEYPLEQDMRVSDLIRAGGGLKPSAYSGTAELTRYVIGADGSRTTELFTVDLRAALAQDPNHDLLLKPYDILTVQKVPEWDQLRTGKTRRANFGFPAFIRFVAVRPSAH